MGGVYQGLGGLSPPHEPTNLSVRHEENKVTKCNWNDPWTVKCMVWYNACTHARTVAHTRTRLILSNCLRETLTPQQEPRCVGADMPLYVMTWEYLWPRTPVRAVTLPSVSTCTPVQLELNVRQLNLSTGEHTKPECVNTNDYIMFKLNRGWIMHLFGMLEKLG